MSKEIRTLTIVSIIAVVVMFLSYFRLFMFEYFPVSGTGLSLVTLISCAIGLRLLLRKDKDENILNFGIFFLLFGIFQLFLFLPHIALFIYHDLDHTLFIELARWGHIIGLVFLFASLVVFIRIPLSFIQEKWKNAGSIFFAGLGLLTIALNIIDPPNPFIACSNGVTIFNIDPLVGAMIGLNLTLAWILSGIFFLYLGHKSSNFLLRRRALLLGSGLIVATIGVSLYAISEPTILFIAVIVTLVGIVVLASGVFYNIEDSESELREQMTGTIDGTRESY